MQTVLTTSMQEATDALIGNLLASEAFIRYQQALASLNQDVEAHTLLEQLSLAQANLRKKQADNDVTQAEIKALHMLQDQVQQNTAILAYSQTQQEAVSLLREINSEISQLLGINFASLANHATC
ncbi:MAG: YlbF family regulator [Chloroflexi bacterium]|nr:YlbF family regulator [Chloroflexota bacterium]